MALQRGDQRARFRDRFSETLGRQLSVGVGGEARELYPKNPVILLPMGSLEDQGPHAPMGDYLLAEKIAELAAIAGRDLSTPEETRAALGLAPVAIVA